MNNFLFILLLGVFLSAVFSFWVCFSLFFTLFYEAPFVPVRARDLQRLEKLIEWKEGRRLYELGSGDGRALLHLVSMKNLIGVGIERSRVLWLLSLWKARRMGLSAQARFVHGNFFKKGLQNADYVICYLLPKVMPKLVKKLRQELQPNTTVISFSFALPGWVPFKIDKSENGGKTIYLYRT